MSKPHYHRATLWLRGQDEEGVAPGCHVGPDFNRLYCKLCGEFTEAFAAQVLDVKSKGVPWVDVDAWYAGELKTSFDSIRNYQLAVYYNGQWKPEYQRWVDMLGGMYAGPDRERVAWNQALTSDMVFNQPVVHEFGDIRVPTTLFIGQLDKTAIGRDRAPAELKPQLGRYPELGRAAAKAIPDATLVEFADLGHSPQVEAPERFNKALLDELAKGPVD